jgi:predicted dinucleotide-binding enzyme
LVELGHEVTMGARDPYNATAAEWAAAAGEGASAGDFVAAAAAGELVVNATAGAHSPAALEQAGAGNLAGKVVLDISNPLDFSAGFPPRLSTPPGDSVAEQLQRAHPDARVVKALNTVNADVMVHPELVPGEHDTFLAGDDAGAKATVTELLAGFGWPAERVVDLGGIQAARGLEAYVLFWVALFGSLGHGHVNVRVVAAQSGSAPPS